eukprot:TRINITY_DN2811_c0_g1_i8.p2 TRINITY_DN2811_c0_g1~~TRINITY_DN2811_c0_g1_i8.p2  ORF type:complete len:149 (+),score=32.95 TRINITY_DN2811_c0_g1_i8:190-636(+)
MEYKSLAFIAFIGAVLVFFLITDSRSGSGDSEPNHGNKTFTYDELAQYNGVKKSKVYIALKGVVLDTTSVDFYKPEGGYHVFAGKDASVALAKMSFDQMYLNAYKTVELNEEEQKALDEWYDQLAKKYPRVGYVAETYTPESAHEKEL